MREEVLVGVRTRVRHLGDEKRRRNHFAPALTGEPDRRHPLNEPQRVAAQRAGEPPASFEFEVRTTPTVVASGFREQLKPAWNLSEALRWVSPALDDRDRPQTCDRRWVWSRRGPRRPATARRRRGRAVLVGRSIYGAVEFLSKIRLESGFGTRSDTAARRLVDAPLNAMNTRHSETPASKSQKSGSVPGSSARTGGATVLATMLSTWSSTRSTRT